MAFEPSAVGRLAPGGPWVGFVAADDGYRLAFGDGTDASGSTQLARRADLLAVAAAYVEGSFDAPPPELEATLHEVGGLVRWLTETEADPARRALLQEALDGVDDGVAGDLLVSRLSAAQAAMDPNGIADPVERLRARHRSVHR